MQLTEFAVGIARQAIPAPRLDNQIEISEVVRVGEVRSEDPHLRQPVEVLWLRVDDRGTVDRALQQRSAFARLMRGSILAIALLALFSAGIFLFGATFIDCFNLGCTVKAGEPGRAGPSHRAMADRFRLRDRTSDRRGPRSPVNCRPICLGG